MPAALGKPSLGQRLSDINWSSLLGFAYHLLFQVCDANIESLIIKGQRHEYTRGRLKWYLCPPLIALYSYLSFISVNLITAHRHVHSYSTECRVHKNRRKRSSSEKIIPFLKTKIFLFAEEFTYCCIFSIKNAGGFFPADVFNSG